MAAHFGNSVLMGVASLSLCRRRLRRIRPNRSGSCPWGPFRRNGRPLPVPLVCLRTGAWARKPAPPSPAAPSPRAPPAPSCATPSPNGPPPVSPAPNTSPTGSSTTPSWSSANSSPTPSCTPEPMSSSPAGWRTRPAPSSWRSWTTTPRAPRATARPRRRTRHLSTDAACDWCPGSPSPGASPIAPGPRPCGRGCPPRTPWRPGTT